MSWKEGQLPSSIWLERKELETKKYGKTFTRLYMGKLKVRGQSFGDKKLVEYRLVRRKKRKVSAKQKAVKRAKKLLAQGKHLPSAGSWKNEHKLLAYFGMEKKKK